MSGQLERLLAEATQTDTYRSTTEPGEIRLPTEAAIEAKNALERLAPDLARLLVDAMAALRLVAWKDSAGLCWCPGETEFAVANPGAEHTPRCQAAQEVLARFAVLEQRAGEGQA